MRRERLFRALVLYWQGLRAEIEIVRTIIKLQLPILSQPVVGISSKSNPRASPPMIHMTFNYSVISHEIQLHINIFQIVEAPQVCK